MMMQRMPVDTVSSVMESRKFWPCNEGRCDREISAGLATLGHDGTSFPSRGRVRLELVGNHHLGVSYVHGPQTAELAAINSLEAFVVCKFR